MGDTTSFISHCIFISINNLFNNILWKFFFDFDCGLFDIKTVNIIFNTILWKGTFHFLIPWASPSVNLKIYKICFVLLPFFCLRYSFFYWFGFFELVYVVLVFLKCLFISPFIIRGKTFNQIFRSCYI